MLAAPEWESSFVAMSVALGSGVDEACLSLNEEARARVAPFAKALASARQDVRAKALARGLVRVALAIEKARLA